jgi:signal transduction histidine kinase
MDKVNILLVDDQPGKLLTYESILGALGENLIKANSANEALEWLLKTDVALALLDVNMPEIDGFRLADMIHQHPRFRDTAIIFISATHLTDQDRLTGYEHGAVDYISVPIVPELLRARVKVFAELHRKTRQLEILNRRMRHLSNAMITMQDEERRRIARDLHDGLGQELTVAKMAADRVRHAKKLPEAQARATDVVALIEDALTQVRSISYLLHPPLLDEAGLSSAVRWYLEGVTKRSGLQTSLEVEPPDFPRLANDIEIALYRIVQEALTNVFRHSGATNAWVILTTDENRVVVTVRDDGKGIPEHVVMERPGSAGVGIEGMRQRLSELGGELRLENTRPGTLVEVVVPLPAVAADQRPSAVGR